MLFSKDIPLPISDLLCIVYAPFCSMASIDQKNAEQHICCRWLLLAIGAMQVWKWTARAVFCIHMASLMRLLSPNRASIQPAEVHSICRQSLDQWHNPSSSQLYWHRPDIPAHLGSVLQMVCDTECPITANETSLQSCIITYHTRRYSM